MQASFNILVVEDSDDDYEVTQRAFKKANSVPSTLRRCESGQETLDYLKREGQFANEDAAPRPNLILLDLNIPGRDGRSVLQEVKTTPSLQGIPVIVLTTSDNQKDIKDCYMMGANTYIRKPVDLPVFFDAIQRLVEYWGNVAILPEEAS